MGHQKRSEDTRKPKSIGANDDPPTEQALGPLSIRSNKSLTRSYINGSSQSPTVKRYLHDVLRSTDDDRSELDLETAWPQFPTAYMRGKLLLAAAGLHLVTSIAVFSFGRLQMLPSLFDVHGVATSFASDGVVYRSEAVSLSNVLVHDSVAAWMTAAPQFHVKLYSLSFATLGHVVGHNVLAVAPLNLLYYLLTIFLVFKLGQEIFDSRIGLAAAFVVALWPSFLLHSTQLLRDPLSTVGLLAMVFFISRWLSKNHTWLEGLVTGAVAAGAAVLLCVVRIEMWSATEGFVFLGVGLVTVKQLVMRRVILGNLVGPTLLLLIVLCLPLVAADISHSGATHTELPIMQQPQSLALRIAKRRQASAIMGRQNAASNIDANVQFLGAGDIARYLPRAAEIGFLAPFPHMWFATGTSVGLSGRLLAGTEMLLTYALEIGVCLSLWQFRRRIEVWLLFLITMIGAIGISLLVVNVGTLYRLRYPFWILLVILGTAGIFEVFQLTQRDRSNVRLRQVESLTLT